MLILEGKSYPVIDVSARGLRFLVSGQTSPVPGTPLKGTLCFRRGARIDLEGQVARIQDREIVLYLTDREIPFTVLMAEQRYLHSHYPMWS